MGSFLVLISHASFILRLYKKDFRMWILALYTLLLNTRPQSTYIQNNSMAWREGRGPEYHMISALIDI